MSIQRTATPQLRELAPFALLTAAEASAFERHLQVRKLAEGAVLEETGSIFLVKEGLVSLQLANGRELLTLEKGAFFGEVELFSGVAPTVVARASKTTELLAITTRSLRHGFHYSRRGMVKWLYLFARSMAGKLRSANDVVSASTAAAGAERTKPLSDVDMRHLRAWTVQLTLAEGNRVFAEGDPSEDLYVIQAGDLDIVRRDGDGEAVIAQFGPGDFFGELSFVDGRPRSAAAVARTELVVHVLPAGALDSVIEQSVGIGIYLTDIICKIIARRLDATLRLAGQPSG